MRNGDPAIAYSYGPSGSFKFSFIGWDRAHYRWNAPVPIGDIGESNSQQPPIALAYDASAHRFVAAYPTRKDAELRIAASPDGAQWSVKTAVSGNDGDFKQIELAAVGGKLFLATQRNDAVEYWTGDPSGEVSKWSHQTVPAPGKRAVNKRFGLAVDANGQPGIAMLVVNETGDGTEPHFWRPGSGATRIAQTPSGGPDDASIRVSFTGSRPWVAMFGKADEKFFSNNHVIWVSALDGASWSPLVWVPNDGGQVFSGGFSLASGSKGQGAITSTVSGGNLEGTRCGPPLLARSDDLSHWKTCGASPLNGGLAVGSAAVMFAVNDLLYIVYQSRGEGGKMPPGVALWRE